MDTRVDKIGLFDVGGVVGLNITERVLLFIERNRIRCKVFKSFIRISTF